MKIIERRGQEMPKPYQIRYNAGMPQLLINVDVKEAERQDQETEIQYEWRSLVLPVGVVDYGSIVSALVTYKYPEDRMQAVINNYLLDPDDAEHKKEFDVMQQDRKDAKRLAKAIVKETSEED